MWTRRTRSTNLTSKDTGHDVLLKEINEVEFEIFDRKVTHKTYKTKAYLGQTHSLSSALSVIVASQEKVKKSKVT